MKLPKEKENRSCHAGKISFFALPGWRAPAAKPGEAKNQLFSWASCSSRQGAKSRLGKSRLWLLTGAEDQARGKSRGWLQERRGPHRTEPDPTPLRLLFSGEHLHRQQQVGFEHASHVLAPGSFDIRHDLGVPDEGQQRGGHLEGGREGKKERSLAGAFRGTRAGAGCGDYGRKSRKMEQGPRNGKLWPELLSREQPIAPSVENVFKPGRYSERLSALEVARVIIIKIITELFKT